MEHKKIYLILLVILTSIFIFNFFKSHKENFTNNKTPIDAVITYVNDQDQEWIMDKEKYNTKDENETINSRKTWRFFNSNEITYCLKCIEKNCNFVRNIFIVIARPSQKCDISFLSFSIRNKIKFITHYDFFYNKEHLPTFNSMAIEHNIHNIPNLSEHFIYFNDDCFINKVVTEEDFVKDDKIIIHMEDNIISKRGDTTNNESGYVSAWKNTNKLLDKMFPETRNENRMVIKHVPQIQLKTIHRKLKELFPENFEITSSSKFRNTKCNLMSAGLAEYFCIYTGLADTGFCDIKNNCSYLQVFVSCETRGIENMIKKIKKINPSFLNIQSTIKNGNCNLEMIYKQIFT